MTDDAVRDATNDYASGEYDSYEYSFIDAYGDDGDDDDAYFFCYGGDDCDNSNCDESNFENSYCEEEEKNVTTQTVTKVKLCLI